VPFIAPAAAPCCLGSDDREDARQALRCIFGSYHRAAELYS